MWLVISAVAVTTMEYILLNSGIRIRNKHDCLSILCIPEIVIPLLAQINADAPLLTPISQMKFFQIDSDIFNEVHKFELIMCFCVLSVN
jgi:hypothetical protein